ncbi:MULTISPECIES: hypothetical protein [unclassified Neptuniibacter]|uniref:hypothetical protein n=1 Tax=unclassified Neptuniibacter TaxID=2630693 RepID=UPI000C362B82|nr:MULTISPECIES: hypothetical protein [unclassified Neptuniibacter]MAY42580.1 hypothetical protein [Oceanospirillaceae bacterium]|tara:strand:- start:23499 stop:23717 length:219 start_codon:yes stop_codon:yes gene_type:complete
MTEDQLVSRLEALSIEQLDNIQSKLLEKVQQRKAERERLKKLPPRTSNDLEALASMQDLDLSSLMRDAKRYS